MNYIVLDLEWNQGCSGRKDADRLNFEIIEIGAVKMNEGRVIVGEFSSLIKPQVYRELHKITSKLIHMQMQELEHGRPFVDVMEDFISWCGDDYIFCTWGPLDLTELQNNMLYHGTEPLAEGPIRFLDVQKLFSLAYEDGKSRRALEYAIDMLQIEKDIPFHRAFSDAYYTGKVLATIPEKICENVSYDLFHPPLTKDMEIKVVFDTYAKYVSRVFPNKTAALADKEVSSSKCYICHKNLKKKIRWFTPNGKHYYCLAHCDKHGYLKGKVRVRKYEEEAVYVVKTTKLISEEDAQQLTLRKEHAQEMKRKKRQKK